MDELDFRGRQVLVVGGSSGIGNGIAQAFRGHGAKVAVSRHARQRGRLSRLRMDRHLEGLDYAKLDVSDAQAIEKLPVRPSIASMFWCWRRVRCSTAAASSRCRASAR